MYIASSFRQEFKAPWQPFKSYVNVDVYTEGHEKLVVVLKDPGRDDSGLSVTNGIEFIIPLVMDRLGGSANLPNITWVEHYPHSSFDGHRKTHFIQPTWDLVTFDEHKGLGGDSRRICNVNWKHLTEEQFEELIKS